VSTNHQFGELLYAYELGALDAPERAALEAHLAGGCADCTAALAEARWMVSQLAYTAPEAAPSDMLRGRLMQIVRAEAASADRGVAKTATVAKPAVPFWMWAAVAALVIATFYSSWNARQVQKQIGDLNDRAVAQLHSREKIEAELASVQRVASILSDPASVKIGLATSQPELGPLQANWNPKLGLVVSGTKIPQPAGNRVLQLWLIPKAAGGKPLPSLVLRPDANGNLVMLVPNPPEVMAEIKALAVSEEPEGGSPQPTTTPKWVGGVS
jgi:anti-sigma-K factor RskA